MNEHPDPLDETPDDEDDTSDVIFHEPRMRDFEPSFGDDELIDLVTAHFDKHIGKAPTVYHELVSDLVHLDVHQIPPAEDRPFHVLYTSGMSERPMHLPEGYDEPRFAELLIILPEQWKLSEADFEDEANYWPIGWMKQLARLPHEYETWLGPGHTVPNGDPPEPFAPNTGLCCMMAVPPLTFDDDFAIIERGEDGADSIGLLMLMPLYREEMEYKLRKSAEELLERFEKAEMDVADLFLPDRPNVCTRRRWL